MAQETPAQRAAEIKAAIMQEKTANELIAFAALNLEQTWDNARDSLNGTAEITLKTTVKIAVSAAGCVRVKAKAERESKWIDNTGEENTKYFPSETDEPVKCDLNSALLDIGGKK